MFEGRERDREITNRERGNERERERSRKDGWG